MDYKFRILDWYKKNKKSKAEISIPSLLKANKINFNTETVNLIGQKAILIQDDLEHCKLLLDKKRVSEIRELSSFDGLHDCVLFYIVTNEESRELLVGVMDPAELYENPYLLSYSFIN